MSERTYYRIWSPERWVWHRQGRITRAICRRFTERTAFVTAAWMAAKWDQDFLVEDPNQGLIWTVTRTGDVR